jgi:hypothetical protein
MESTGEIWIEEDSPVYISKMLNQMNSANLEDSLTNVELTECKDVSYLGSLF